MEDFEPRRIKKTVDNHRVLRPTQTGFSSPATHYNEPRIDLNDVLASNSDSTFYIRVIDNSFNAFNIHEKDVIIVDKSITPINNQLAIVILDGSFQIIRIDSKLIEELNVWGVITFIIKAVL